MIVKKIEKVAQLDSIDTLFDGAEYQKIDNVNWSGEYPAKPDVEFAILHDGDNIFLRYNVKENCTMAVVTEDHGEVWTDSCVEFFVTFDDTGYYNLESTVIGRSLLGFRQSRDNATSAPSDVMAMIKRYPSMGSEPFSEIKDTQWTLSLIIPKETFFAHNIETFSSLECSANFYKCGDNLSEPHFLSWNKIDNATPNFHLPQFFGELKFE